MTYSVWPRVICSLAAITMTLATVVSPGTVQGDEQSRDNAASPVDINDYLAQRGSIGTAVVWLDFTAISASCAFVDTAGKAVGLQKQLMPSPAAVANQQPLLDNTRLSLVLSPSLKESLDDFIASIGGILERSVSADAANPLACYEAAFLGTRLRAALTDLNSEFVDLSQNRTKTPRLLVAGLAMGSDGDAVSVQVSRVVVVEPPIQQHVARYQAGGGLRAMILDSDGSTCPVDFYDMSLVGSSDFLEECRRTSFLGKLFGADGFIEYRRQLLVGDLKEVNEWNAGIQKDIIAITSDAKNAALSRAGIKKDLAVKLEKRQADEMASFLGERQGAAFVRSIAALLQGHEEPLEQLLRCDRQFASLDKRLSQEGIDWFLDERMKKVGVVAVDSNKLWLIQIRAAVAVVGRMCDTLLAVAGERAELTEQKISQLTRKGRGDGHSGLTEQAHKKLIAMIEETTIQGWENTAAGRSRLPQQPSMPSPPRRQVGGRSLEQTTGLLERRADRAMASGDIDAWMEAQGAIGAAAAQELGSSQLMNAFGDSANATARMYRGSPTYSVDTSDPGYQRAKAQYSEQMAAWNANKDEMNRQLTGEFNAKKQSILQQLQVMWQVDQEVPVQPLVGEVDAVYFVPNLAIYAR